MTVSASSCHVTFTTPLGYVGGIDIHCVSQKRRPPRRRGFCRIGSSMDQSVRMGDSVSRGRRHATVRFKGQGVANTERKRLCWTNKPCPYQSDQGHHESNIPRKCTKATPARARFRGDPHEGIDRTIPYRLNCDNIR